MSRVRGRVVAFVMAGVLVGGSGLAGCSDEPAGQAPAAPASGSPSSAAAPDVTREAPKPAATEAASPPAGSDSPSTGPSTNAPVGETAAVVASNPELIAAGRSTYNANCIACHAMDPRQDGALGPAVAGSPLELIEARVMRAEYPAGYTPKRTTKVMIPLPHLQPKLPELAAYLGSLK